MMIETIREVISSFGSDKAAINEFLSKLFERLFELYLEHPFFKLTLAFIPALLAMAYPLLMNTVSRLNEQYNSSRITTQLRAELLHKLFIWILIFSVFATLLCFTMSWTVFIIAFLSTVILIIVFFLYMNLIFKYLDGNSLYRTYRKRVNLDFSRTKKNSDRKIFKTKKKLLKYWNFINDLFLYSIQKSNRSLEYDIRNDFIYPAYNFIAYIDQKGKNIVEYPPEFYNSTFDIVSRYISTKEEDYYQNIEIFCGSIFFISNSGRKEKRYLHPDTLFAIWRNLSLLVEHNRGDKIVKYWESAHQYFNYDLRFTDDENNEGMEDNIERKDKNDVADANRKLFYELHAYLGAYLMYKKNYQTLNSIWFFSQSQPPVYVLVPKFMDQVFDLFFNHIEMNISRQLSMRYRFRELDFESMNYRPDVISKLREYSGLLFLRQWFIHTSYYGYDPLDYPKIPVEQSVKKMWKENLPYFRAIVKKHLDNEELMQSLHINNLTKENCEKDKRPYPLDFIDNLIERVEKGFESTIKEEPLDKVKVKGIIDYSIASLNEIKEHYRLISGGEVTTAERDMYSEKMIAIRGRKMILPREAFIANTSTYYIDFEKAVPNAIRQEYSAHVSSKLHLNSKVRFVVPHGSSFKAVDMLKLDPQKHIIISFRRNIEYYKNYQNININLVKGSSEFEYNGIPFFNLESSHPLTYNKLYILSAEDRPMIKHIDWKVASGLDERDKMYWQSLGDPVDKNIFLYLAIREFNNNEGLIAEYLENGESRETLEKSIEVTIDFIAYCWFKKSTRMIEISESEIFQESGSKDPFEAIGDFDSNFQKIKLSD